MFAYASYTYGLERLEQCRWTVESRNASEVGNPKRIKPIWKPPEGGKTAERGKTEELKIVEKMGQLSLRQTFFFT